MATVVDTQPVRITRQNGTVTLMHMPQPQRAVSGQPPAVISMFGGAADTAQPGHIPHENLQPATQKLLKLVVRLATLMAILAVLKNVIILYFFDGVYANMVDMLLSLVIPYCGYVSFSNFLFFFFFNIISDSSLPLFSLYLTWKTEQEGARKRNRAMVTCFWGCNAFNFATFVLQAYWAISLINAQDSSPSEHVDMRTDHGRVGTYVVLSISFVTALLQLLGFYFGRRLAYSEAMLIIEPNRYMVNGELGGLIRYVQPGAGANNAAPSAAPRGVDPVVLAGLHTEVLTEESLSSGDWDEGGKSSMCVICLDDFVKGDKLKKLPCGHHFHVSCIDKWLTEHHRCPTCNFDFQT